MGRYRADVTLFIRVQVDVDAESPLEAKAAAEALPFSQALQVNRRLKRAMIPSLVLAMGLHQPAATVIEHFTPLPTGQRYRFHFQGEHLQRQEPIPAESALQGPLTNGASHA